MRSAEPIAKAALILALAAGCSGHSAADRASASPTGGLARLGRQCGIAHTAANVPVIIEVPATAVTCEDALRVQDDYARKLRAGQAPGNGGGGPVPVDGWICQGYPTPQVLQTGRASECHRGGLQFFAVLPAPTGSPAP